MSAPRRRGRKPEKRISPREWEVLELLVEGLSNEKIAARLELGRRTVETHIDRARAKVRDFGSQALHPDRHIEFDRSTLALFVVAQKPDLNPFRRMKDIWVPPKKMVGAGNSSEAIPAQSS